MLFCSVDLIYFVLLCYFCIMVFPIGFFFGSFGLTSWLSLTPETATRKISFTALVPLLRYRPRDIQRGYQPALCRSQPINNGTWTSLFSALLFTHLAIPWRYADWILAAWRCPETGYFLLTATHGVTSILTRLGCCQQ